MVGVNHHYRLIRLPTSIQRRQQRTDVGVGERHGCVVCAAQELLCRVAVRCFGAFDRIGAALGLAREPEEEGGEDEGEDETEAVRKS